MGKNRLETIEALRAIAHQWRQPLNLISMEAINLTVHGNLDSKVNSNDVIKSANIISEQTQRISHVLNSILNIGKEQRAKELFSINELLKSINTFFNEQLQVQNIILNINYLENDEQIYGYFIDLQEVLVNIISNAKDAYMENKNKNKNEKKISVDVNVTKDNYVFIIKDEAGGVPDEIREKIFDSNFSTKTTGKSFGIGLYIAKLIIEHEFGGTINLRSNHLGSEFIINVLRNDVSNLNFIS